MTVTSAVGAAASFLTIKAASNRNRESGRDSAGPQSGFKIPAPSSHQLELSSCGVNSVGFGFVGPQKRSGTSSTGCLEFRQGVQNGRSEPLRTGGRRRSEGKGGKGGKGSRWRENKIKTVFCCHACM